MRAHKRGELKVATELYRECLRAQPTSLDALANLAAVLVRRGRAREAMQALEDAERLGSSSPRVLRDVGVGFATLGALAAARRALSRSITLDHDQVGALLVWSRVCGEDGAPDEALELAVRATAMAPGDPSSWIERHRATLARDPRSAVECAAEALRLDPSSSSARLLHAGAQIAAGERPECELLPEALRAAVAWAAAHRAPSFGYKRDALVHALALAPLEGAVIEMGVRFGVSTRLIAANTPRVVHGFDSFEGLPLAWGALPAGAFSMEGEAPELPANVSLHVGAFADALPAFAASLDRSPAFVHIDSDLYDSARETLDALGPSLASGAVLLFDEYLGNASWRDDEHRAFTGWVSREGWSWQALSCSLATGQVALRLDARV